MSYRVVYDLAACGYDWTFVVFGVVFIVVAIAFARGAFRRGVRTGLGPRLMAGFAVMFALIWTGGAFLGTFLPYLAGRDICARGGCAVVEGSVEQYRVLPTTGTPQKRESFVVRGVRFEYSGYDAAPGFRQMASQGGPLRDGLPV